MQYPMNQQDAVKLLSTAFCPLEVQHKTAKERFLDACKNGEQDILKAYISLGISLNFQEGYNKMCPLVKATETKQHKVIELLLEYGANLEQKDGDGDTALHTAINWQHPETLKFLLSKGANPNNLNRFKWTPLTKCIKENYRPLLEILLSSDRLDPNIGAEHEVSSLHFAINNKSNGYDTAMAVLNKGYDCSVLYNKEKGLTFIMQAVLNQWTFAQKQDIIQALIEKGVDLNAKSTMGMTALDIARLQKNDDLVAFFQSLGAEGDDKRYWQLFDAAINNNEATLNKLLAEGFNPNKQDLHGYTPLSRAVQHNHANLVQLLLEAGADPNIAAISKWAPISFCCQANKMNIFQLLVDAGATVNDVPGYSRVLLNAVRYQRPQMLQLLLKDPNLAINTVDSYEQSALVLAANNNDVEMIKMLVAAGIDTELKTDKQTTALGVAAYNGKFDALYALIEAGVELDSEDYEGKTALFKLCDKYNNRDKAYADAAQALLEAGASNLSKAQWQDGPLAAAKSSKNYVCIEVLENWLGHGHYNKFRSEWQGPENEDFWFAYAQSCNYEHLNELIRIGDRNRLQKLLQAGLSPNPPYPVSDSPLSVSGELKDLEIMDLLLEFGADPNFKSRSAETPLFRVGYKGDAACVKRLLEAGADASIVSEYDSMALSWAVTNNDTEVMRLIYDACPEAVDICYPFHAAAGQGLIKIVRWFVEELGFDVDSRNEHGRTALLSAMGKFHKKVIWYLVEKGADLNIVDKNAESPLYKALLKNQEEIARFLLEQGADPEFQLSDKTIASAVGTRQNLKDLLEEFTGKIIQEDIQAKLIENVQVPTAFQLLFENDLEGLKAIINADNINQQNYRGDSLLMLAIGMRKWDIAKWLTEQKGIDLLLKNTAGDTAWTYSTISGRPLEEVFDETTAAVINEALDVNQQADLYMRMDDLRKAIDHGDLKKVQELLDKKKIGLNFLDSQRSPIFRAIKNKDATMLEFILKKGADPNLPAVWGTHYPITEAIHHKDAKMLKILLEHNSKINFPKINAFVKAVAEEASIEILRSLLDAGADIDAICPYYQANALHLAIQQEQLEILQFLIDADVDLEKEDPAGNSPLHLARNQAEWVAELIEEEL
jgi:ankyrin repeat protein